MSRNLAAEIGNTIKDHPEEKLREMAGKSEREKTAEQAVKKPRDVREKKSQADTLIELTKKAGAEFFHTLLGEPFISFPSRGGADDASWRSATNAERCSYSPNMALANCSRKEVSMRGP